MIAVGSGEFKQFLGKQTSPEEREDLRKAGFVHLTGLRTSGWDVVCGREHTKYIIGEKLGEKELGKWDYNNGVYVVVTTGGEVWVAIPPSDQPEIHSRLQDVARAHAPNGKGAFVPLSNGEMINAVFLFRRVADPYCGLLMRIS